MPGFRADAASGRRGQSEVVGLGLLFGFTLFAAVGVLFVGGTAMDALEGSANVQNAENSMREADARLSQVAFSSNDAHTLDFSGQDGDVRVTDDGTATITTVGNDSATCSADIEFGSITYEADDGGEVTYQAGGVWKRTEAGSVMLSPPDLQYRNGSFSFRMVDVSGGVNGSVESLRATKDAAASRERSEQLREAFAADRCTPPKKIVVSVDSEYYRAWGEYFRSHFDTGTTAVYDANRTASMTVTLAGTGTENRNRSLAVQRNATASVELLSTEISGTQTRRVGCDEWAFGFCVEPVYADYKYNAPVTMRVNVGDRTYEPWTDVANPASVAEKDVNDPTDGPESRSFTTNVSAGDNVSVEATGYGADSYDWNDYEEVSLNGEMWRSVGAEAAGDETVNITVDADDGGDNEGNVVLLADGMAVPSYGSASDEQRNMSQVLGGRMNETGHLDLAPNAFVLVYELSCADATTDDVGDSDKCGSGDPDYNDAVALVTVEERGSVDDPENLAVHISMNQVAIEEGS
ncbi:DUF7289 family protein [Halorussus halobius]|uniref:DUF7289 family protein n=1 Tax=Halorussus halobius TaxID=1710537 RepID=UPI0010924E84|nr:hypothetical protein [Halorussus halobius]